KEALEQTDRCPLLLEQTAGHKGLLGRDFDQTARLIELAGEGRRLGLCLDSCHLFVQGYDIRDAERLSAVLDEADEKVGLERLSGTGWVARREGRGPAVLPGLPRCSRRNGGCCTRTRGRSPRRRARP